MQLAEPVREAGAGCLGRDPLTPRLLGEVIRDLDLGATALDVHQPAVTDELAGLVELHRPQPEAMLALVSDEPLDRSARPFDGRRRPAWNESHDVVPPKDALVQRRRVVGAE